MPLWAANHAPCEYGSWPYLLLVCGVPLAGGRCLTSLSPLGLGTGDRVPPPPCSQEPVCPEAIVCRTMPQATPGAAEVHVAFGHAQRTLFSYHFHYTGNPQLTAAEPSASFQG